MSMLIQHNMMAWNAERQFNTVTKAKNKKSEKLSSGYRINRAADDAAGLAISEKMRRQIRGLKVGTENAQMGISWVQIGEGALNEAHDILHRMNELSIKAQNGTNTRTDRAYMEAEFEQLQGELDRISTTTTFNELNIFEEHEPVYDQISGNIRWDYEEPHEILAGKNQLTIAYRDRAESKAQTMTITVPPGKYTTHELIDEIDDAFGIDSPIHMEFTDKGICKLNLEDGEVMDSVTGGLTYLLWDNYDGGGYGTLIGTTEFEKETDTIRVVRGQNDTMYLEWESFDPNVSAKSGTLNLLQAGETDIRLTKKQIMDRIDAAIANDPNLKDTGLKTSHHGYAIQLSSDEGIVTGFKGNMFKIENEDPIYTSAFYDNIQHGYVWQDPASVVGGAVLTTDVRDEEHNRYYIDSSNNTLVLSPNTFTNSVKTPITINITPKGPNDADPTKGGYTAQEMVVELNRIFEGTTGLKGEVKAYLVNNKEKNKVREEYPDKKDPTGGASITRDDVGDDNLIFQGIEIRTLKEGPDAIVNIDRAASTAYDTLFTVKNYNKYGTAAQGWDATVGNETKADYNAYARGEGEVGKIRFTSANNQFELTIKSTSNRNTTSSYDYVQTFTIDVGRGSKNLSQIISAINSNFKTHEVVVGKDEHGNDIKVGLDTRIEAVADGNHIKIVDKEDLTLDNAEHTYPNWNTEIDLGFAGTNAGYRLLFQRREDYTENLTYTFTGSKQLTIPSGGMTGPITFYVNGVPHTIGGDGMTAAQAKDKFYQETPIMFSTVSSTSQTRPQNFTVKGDGTTTYTYWAGGSAKGDSKEWQGKGGFEMNTPATLEIGPPNKIPSKVKIDSTNNTISLALNGKPYKFTLAASAGSDYDYDNDGMYDQGELEDALQAAIDHTAGKGFGGAVVEIKNNQFVITSRLGNNDDGKQTSIKAYAQGQADNTFFDSLVRSETAASCTSTLEVQSSVSLDSTNDLFSFSFKDKNGNSQNVAFHLLDPGETSATCNRTQLEKRIRDKLAETGTLYEGKVAASIVNNRLVLTTTDEGAKTHIEYTTGAYPNATANAKAIFGDIQASKTDPAASVTLNKNAKKQVSFDNSTDIKTFRVQIDNQWRDIKIQGGWSNYADLENKLNKGLSGNGSDGLENWDVEANVSSLGQITLTKKTPGGNTSITMSYDSSNGSVMKDMFGTTQASRASDVELSVGTGKNSNKLTITAIGADGKPDPNAVINIDSKDSGGTLEGKPAVKYWSHTKQSGFHSAKFSTVTSVDLKDYVTDGIKLDRWNNELKFEFCTNGTAAADADKNWQPVSFRLTESGPNPNDKTSIDDIVKELQTKIDGKLGKDKIEVLFENNRLMLKSTKPGAQFQFRGLKSERSNGVDSADATNKIGGGFYHHVMCKSEEQKKTLDDPTDINGDQFPGDIFAQGRHDLIFDRASLHPGMSDTLTLDLNYIADTDHDGKLDGPEKTITLTFKLTDPDVTPALKVEDWLTASSDEVVQAFQVGIKDAIKDWNTKNPDFQLHEDLIEVGIGKHQTGIWGNKDDVSLSFTITKDKEIATPVEGYFYIDGIRGNAAYETFYYTEGDLIPAYIVGTKDISDGVVLGEHDNELLFLVDGEMKRIDLSKLDKGKKYSAEEIIKTLTKAFEDQKLPLAASITQKGALKISFDRMGKHTIEQVTGSARNKLFFEEHTAKRPKREREIRVSSNEGDRIEVYSPRFSTAMLGVNSICISTIKNAEKATNRLKEALKKVSDMRGTFGALQNRFEHTVNNNRNKEENTQAAESRIRDADISKEMVEFSNQSIIQQAGQAVLAQANQSRNAMLTLLG